jgi:hypothetical protein
MLELNFQEVIYLPALAEVRRGVRQGNCLLLRYVICPSGFVNIGYYDIIQK